MLDQQGLRGVGQLELDPPLGQPTRAPAACSIDDLGQLLLGQRLERDDLVDPVQELGPERRLQVAWRSRS
jgi:hypothetical protein